MSLQLSCPNADQLEHEIDRCQILRLIIEEQDEEKIKKRKEEEERELAEQISSFEEQINEWGVRKLLERE